MKIELECELFLKTIDIYTLLCITGYSYFKGEVSIIEGALINVCALEESALSLEDFTQFFIYIYLFDYGYLFVT